MIIVVKNGKVWATHSPTQQNEITQALYPAAEKIIELSEGVVCQTGDDDPTLAHPSWAKRYIYAPIQMTYITPETIVLMDAGKLTTLIPKGKLL